MSKSEEEKLLVAVIDEEAWLDFYALMDVVSDQLMTWANKHDLPIGVMVGAGWAVAGAVSHFADLCDCAVCKSAETLFVAEAMERIKDAESKIGRAVH
jgi:hypothetical protein